MVVDDRVVVNDDVMDHVVLPMMLSVMRCRIGKHHGRAQDNGGEDEKGFHHRNSTTAPGRDDPKLAIS